MSLYGANLTKSCVIDQYIGISKNAYTEKQLLTRANSKMGPCGLHAGDVACVSQNLGPEFSIM